MENPTWNSRAPIKQHDSSNARATDVQHWPKIVTKENCDDNSTRRPYNSDKRLFNISINFPQQSRAQFNFPGSQRKQYKS
ncbi:uncharacterized protein SETTUDRAFT_29655 [Exserohilum turcica Et28A]|uniref:Uncharacterized protein n=1 Tax=Exserohilum turcicum (strain 28A) TaxID=671987 RepID=R0K4G8_EXST2|nr:uncharacterized protein SETTUDRAFT_29655 [Exserohilum turcica Et28A]EOA84449.1 hypothetical protein SETTUDRAFT_29655 [Exserohilum turcica Et28A]